MSRSVVRKGILRRASRSFLVASAALLVAWAPAQAQTGTVTGTVRDATNGQPIAGAQVSIPALNIGALANNVGRFLLLNVPAGTHQVQFQYIGYGTETIEVTVAAGQTATADARLRNEAISLEGVVVTGTAGASSRREIGNSISQINQSAIEAAPVTDVADILQGRATGFATLALARVGVGIGEAGCSPPAHSMLADLFPQSTRSTTKAPRPRAKRTSPGSAVQDLKGPLD